MKNKIFILSQLVIFTICLCACTNKTSNIGEYQASIENAGFEAGSIDGWEMSGNIYNNENVTDISIINNEKTTHEGRYHLSGMNQDSGATGFLKSSSFKITKNNMISFLIAGGKNKEKCYVAICDKSDDSELIKATNTYFIENPIKTASKENSYARIILDLKEFKGKEVYVKIVDNDSSDDFGYLSVDAFDVSISEAKLTTYKIDQKNRYVEKADVIVDSKYQVKNGGFENNFEDWTITSGESFAEDTIINDTKWVLFNDPALTVPYYNEGRFYAGWDDESKIGVLRSSTFEMGGNGKISFKIGGGRSGALCYISLYEKVSQGTDVEIARFSNQLFHEYGGWKGSQTGNPLYICNMVKYKFDASSYIGKELYFEIHDRGTDLFNMFFLDSFITYYEDGKESTDKLASAVEAIDIKPVIDNGSKNQIVNGSFETGDLTGWTSISGNAYKTVSTQNAWWVEKIPFNKTGNYYIGDVEKEEYIGTIRSSNFIVSGSGFITFKLGGGGNPDKNYISIKKVSDNTEVARFANDFTDVGFPDTGQMRMFNMTQYGFNLSEFMGQDLYIEIVDNASSSVDGFFKTLVCDDFITYHLSAPQSSSYRLATNKK